MQRDGLLARLADSEVADAGAATTASASPRPFELIWRLLDGDHRAMLQLLDGNASDGAEQRREREVLLSGFVDAAAARAIELGIIDVAMGNPFWDTFTIEQCRQIIVALASMGRRFDGREGWVDGQAPGYRDLSQAVADVGMDPRRIRAWPHQGDIAELFRGARPATREAVQRFAASLEPIELQAFLGESAAGLDDLWRIWDTLREATPTTA